MGSFSERIVDLRSRCNSAFFNKITLELIAAHRSGNISLLKYVGQLNGFEGEGIELFSKLILLYHPDRLQSYLKSLDEAEIAGDESAVSTLEVLLSVDPKKAGIAAVNFTEDDYEGAGEDWTYGEEDFDSVRSSWFDNDAEYDLTDSDFEDDDDPDESRSLFEAVQAREYGAQEVGLQPHHLDYFQGTMDLSDYEIDDLAGAEHLVHVRVLNLSANHIHRVSRLHSLLDLEELYLAGNDVDDLTGLESLRSLRILDLENNRLEDIEPVLNLPSLEFVNLLGNRVRSDQAQMLRKKGIIVLTDSLLLD